MAEVLDDLTLMTFPEASAVVVAYLRTIIPLGSWTVTEYVDGRQVNLAVADDVYGLTPGGSTAWSETFCQYVVTGRTPQIAPDAMAVPEYAAVAAGREVPIGAYVGVPIRAADGRLFGTLCGIDPAVASPDLLAHAPGLRLLSTLLGQILQADRLRADAVEREAQLRHQVHHDHLTGLPNRVLFLDRVGHALDLHRRDRRSVAVLVLDLDDFKAVNDTLGHAAGDDLLVQVADRFRVTLRAGDTVARLSGDEFAVLLEDGGEPAVVADHLVRCLAEPFRLAGTAVRMAASVGVADLTAAAGPLSVDTIVARADLAMYTAKRSGKGRLAMFDPTMRLAEGSDLRLGEPLRAAIADGTLSAVFQPVVDLPSGRTAGYETLARWRHEAVDVPPDVFVPVAARTGQLGALTDHVLELAGAQLARWNTQLGHRRLRVSVNVPPDVLGDTGFADRVAAGVARHGLGRGQLVLEITEDALMSDPPTARAVAHRLRALGVLLSLDDFGAGYSSLLHLQQIPLHSVKIDRGFTGDLDTNPHTERFMRALLSLGRDLGLHVIVEGVERPGQAATLSALGCRFAQGYLLGRPAAAPDLSPAAAVPPTVPARRVA